MYLRNLSSKKEEELLINMIMENFKVNEKNKAKEILYSSDKILIMCNRQNDILGFICYKILFNGIAFIHYILINQQYRNKGIGSKFVPILMKYFRDRKIYKVCGFVSKDNLHALYKFNNWGAKTILSLEKGFLIGKFIN